ncbi:MAG: bifunctional demethylmenaquinone methyltransferase/2-methoxy-6-polyprenyl-1,4-benzoquinol methylase UbiE [Acidobacteriota bacterium]
MSPDAPDLGLDKAPARISGMFDAIAHRYDLLNHVLSGGCDAYWRWKAIAALGLCGGETVLDLCSGTADLAIAAMRGPRGAARVVGLDFSSGMLRYGARKLERRGLAKQIWLTQADAMRLPIRSDSIDAATVAFGIRNVESPAVVFQDVLRVLRPGGRFAILEFALPPRAIIRQVYMAYFRHVLPRVGRLLSGHTSAYSYLPASVSTFPEPAVMRAALEREGFIDVRAVQLTMGVVYLYSAAKRLDR